jgi:hypothetical protein
MQIALDLAGFEGIPDDSAVYVPGEDLQRILFGLDIGAGELVMARQLGYDAIVAHHPVGLAHCSWAVFRPHAEFLREMLAHIKGASAFVLLSKHEPDHLVVARLGNARGLRIGVGDGEMFVASDIPAILEHTRDMIFLEDHQMAIITRDGAKVNTLTGEPVDAKVHAISWDPVSAAKGGLPSLHAKGDLRAGSFNYGHHSWAGSL